MLVGGIIICVLAVIIGVAVETLTEDIGCLSIIGLVFLFLIGVALILGGISGGQAAADFLRVVFS